MTTYTSNPTTENSRLTTDELTEMLNEERYARTLTNIARRAENLWADGYKWEKFATDFYKVFTPKGEIYTVITDGDTDAPCDCPAFATYGECKHRLAIDWMLRDEAQAAAFDAMMADGETATGCDPFARY